VPSFGPISSAPISAISGSSSNIVSQSITALCATTVTIARRQVGKFITAPTSATTSVRSGVAHLVSLSCSTAVSVTKAAGKSIAAAVQTTVTAAHSLAKVIVASVSTLVTITNAKAFFVTITAFVQTVVSIIAGRYRTPAERIVYVPFFSREIEPPFESRVGDVAATDRTASPFFVTRVVMVPKGTGQSRKQSIE